MIPAITTTPPDRCGAQHLDQAALGRLRSRMVDDQAFRDLAETFRALGDPTRAKIIYALSQQELCVHELAGLLNATPSAMSHHLRLLRTMRLVRYRKCGKAVYYCLDDQHVRRLFAEGLEHLGCG